MKWETRGNDELGILSDANLSVSTVCNPKRGSKGNVRVSVLM